MKVPKEMKRMKTTLSTITVSVVAAFLLLSLLSVPLSASAKSAPNCTPTNCNLKGYTMSFGPLGPDPCNGVLPNPSTLDLAPTGNLQMHSIDMTHVTGTFEGWQTFQLMNGVTISLHLESWFGGNFNPSTGHFEASDTLNIAATGSDGSSLSANFNSHITILPDGTIVVNVFNMNLVCG
jgi:hypothetical protein